MTLRFLFRPLWIAAIVTVAAVTLLPMPNMSELPQQSDKVAHFACYAILGCLAVLAQKSRRWQVLAVLAMVVMGVAIECIQYFLPWRSFEAMDMLANTVGVASGVIVSLLWPHVRRGGRGQ